MTLTPAQIELKRREITYGLNKAMYDESVIREGAFLNINHDINGVEVCPLSFRRYILLDFRNSPFLKQSRELTKEDVWEFIWIVSTEFELGKPSDDFVKRKMAAMADENGDINYEFLIKEVLRYLEDALLDLPDDSKKSATKFKNEIAETAWVAVYVVLLASEFGWSDEYILDLPMARVFQYVRIIESKEAAKAGEPIKHRNRLSSDWFDKLKQFTDDVTNGRPMEEKE